MVQGISLVDLLYQFFLLERDRLPVDRFRPSLGVETFPQTVSLAPRLGDFPQTIVSRRATRELPLAAPASLFCDRSSHSRRVRPFFLFLHEQRNSGRVEYAVPINRTSLARGPITAIDFTVCLFRGSQILRVSTTMDSGWPGELRQ